MKKIAFLIVALMLTAGISSAQEKVRIDSLGKDTVKVPTYAELTRMVSRLTARVDSARQRAVEDSILIARFVEQSRQAALASMPPPKKPTFWTNSLLSQFNFSQTSLTNWAAGGNSSIALGGYVDAKANYDKDKILFQNRLQVGYGFVKMFGDILKKTDDRLLLDSKFGYKATEKLYFSAAFGIKTQMAKGYKYAKTDTTLVSQFAAPLYSTLALGLDYKPFSWLSVTFAPLTGGIVVVRVPELRGSTGTNPMKKCEKSLEPS